MISEENVYLAANGRRLPLDVWPIDAFGTRTVPLQSIPESSPSAPVYPNNVTTIATTINTIN